MFWNHTSSLQSSAITILKPLVSSLSPLSDCLVLLIFKDKSDKAQGNRERASVTLEEICGLEAGQWYEGVAFTLVILCLNQTVLLGFDAREPLQAWDARLRYSLGEGEENLLVLFFFFLQCFPLRVDTQNRIVSDLAVLQLKQFWTTRWVHPSCWQISVSERRKVPHHLPNCKKSLHLV